MFPFTAIRIIDDCKRALHFSPLLSFAYDDAFACSVGHGKSLPILRAWIHRPAVVLGIQDGRLPYLEDGIRLLQNLNFSVIMRNSGGLAVLIDEGVLNLSLIVKEDQARSIDDGFRLMAGLIRRSLAPFAKEVAIREIAGSYCPGKYDLSIDGKKFAGLCQRRIQGGAAIQAYLCVSGSGADRAGIIAEFYDTARKKTKTKIAYPSIAKETMASLSELTGKKLSPSTIWHGLLQTLKTLGIELVANNVLTTNEQQAFQFYKERIEERNEKLLSFLS